MRKHAEDSGKKQIGQMGGHWPGSSRVCWRCWRGGCPDSWAKVMTLAHHGMRGMGEETACSQ